MQSLDGKIRFRSGVGGYTARLPVLAAFVGPYAGSRLDYSGAYK